MYHARIAASCVLIAFLAACGSDAGPKTHDYLVKVSQTTDQMESDLAQQSPPKLPAMPDTVARTDASAAGLRHWREEMLTKFFPALTKSVDQVSAICDQAESKAGTWTTAEVDPAAVDYASKVQLLIDHRQQMAVQLAGLVAEQRGQVQDNHLYPAGLKLLEACSDALFSPSDAATVPDDLSQSKMPAGKEFATVEHTLTDWRRDAGAAASAKSSLMSSLKEKYPSQDWGFLAAKGK